MKSEIKLFWHQKQWSLLKGYQEFPNVVLLTGPEGLGKKIFGIQLGQSLLCTKSYELGNSCQICRECWLCQNNAHPDLFALDSKEEIKIVEIREIIKFISLAPGRAKRKVVFINNAELMNQSAVNALLKSIEEPNRTSKFILISRSSEEILPTLKSRCQIIRFPIPKFDNSMNWLLGNDPKLKRDRAATLLAIAAGAPLGALEIQKNSEIEKERSSIIDFLLQIQRKDLNYVSMIPILKKTTDIQKFFQFTSSFFSDLLIWQFTGKKESLLNQDLTGELKEIGEVLSVKESIKFLAALEKLHHTYKSSWENLNFELFLFCFIALLQKHLERTEIEEQKI